jgi:hypothetical protein
MKAAKSALISVLMICLIILLGSTAAARSRVFVGIGVGYPAYYHYHGWHDGYYGHAYWRHGYPYHSAVIIGGGYWYDWGPDYWVVEPAPAAIEPQVVIIQPSVVDNNTQELFKKLRNEKEKLLSKLQSGNKEQRKEAIDNLAGFSFDDNVRAALEKVLLSDNDPELRKEAAAAFGKVRNAKALPALEKARVEDSSEEVRRAADIAIKNIG